MRRVLPLLVLLALLAPHGGAALGTLAGVERVVICRGDAVVTVSLAADGTPVGTAEEAAAPCLAAALPRLARAPDRGSTTLDAVPGPSPRRAGTPPADPLWHGPPPMRAPPTA